MQLLPNGNLVVTNFGPADETRRVLPPGEGDSDLAVLGEEGTILEVDWDGNKVWEWVPVYKPMRPNRYAYDFCPQLQCLEPKEMPIDLSERMPKVVGSASV